MTKANIYIAYTGGTIGMKKTDIGFVPVSGFLTKCIQAMPEFYHAEMPNFVIQEYSPLIDSSNMKPTHWQQIANDIKANYEKYDGFVILHGNRYHGLYSVGPVLYIARIIQAGHYHRLTNPAQPVAF